MNRYPYNSGHILVAPYRHIGELPLLTKTERDEMMNMLMYPAKFLQS